jgi:hypothetical protein
VRTGQISTFSHSWSPRVVERATTGFDSAAPPIRKAEVVHATDAHAPLLAEFFRKVWDSNATAEGVLSGRAAAAASNPVTPGQTPPEFLFLADGRIVGYVGSIPVRLWNGSKELSAHWVKGLMVLPEFRNGPVGFMVLKEAVKHLSPGLSIAGAPAALRLLEALKFTNLGPVPNFIRILRPARVMQRLRLDRLGLPGLPTWMPRVARIGQVTRLAVLGGAVAAALTPLWIRARCGGPGSCVIRLEHSPGTADEIDELWMRCRPQMGCAVVRDNAYWHSSYASDPSYRFVRVEQGNQLAGIAAVRASQASNDPRLQGIRVATLSDVVFPFDQFQTGTALLTGAERLARDLEADALLCSVTHPSMTALLPRHAFLRLPGNLCFLFRESPGEQRLAATQTSWFVMRGDSNADEVF